VNLIQSVEDLRGKRKLISLKKKKKKTNFWRPSNVRCNIRSSWVSSVLLVLEVFGLSNLHNFMNQFLK